jgi:sRNA-binding protein
VANLPTDPAKNVTGDFDPAFIEFARRVISVPHSEIKAKLDAEREDKRTSKASASPAPAAPSKAH